MDGAGRRQRAALPVDVKGVFSDPFRRLWRWMTAPPDPALADAARDGEMMVARVRMWVTLLLLLIPVVGMLLGGATLQNRMGLLVAVTAVAVAAGLAVWVQRGPYRPRISFVSAVTDVSLVSLGLFAFWAIRRPIVTTNSRVIFECYFLAIGASALRHDPRVTVAAGAASIGEYLGLSFLAWRTYGGTDLMRTNAYGTFGWSTEISRATILFGMTLVALAIVNRVQHLRHMSTGDRVTGLFNRAYAEEFLANELLRTARFRSALVIGMIDVDHFKRFNDTHGHRAGDVALKTVATTARRALRRIDVVARFGGDEILLLLPGTTVQAGLEKLEEIRIAIGSTDIPLPHGSTALVTVSIGVAAWGVDGTTVDALLDTADARLYAAKAAGRNRLIDPVAADVS